MITECASQAAKGMIARRDAILKEAIDARIGQGWSAHDLVGRIEMQITVSTGYEQVILDGKPLIEFYQAEPTTEAKDLSYYIGYTQKYRLL